ncbi:MAG TPA: AraC family transcriptional regulator [Planctomycetota bacterium]|nr:AraC family transcriptional regulator [Planctomycetota bacterium]
MPLDPIALESRTLWRVGGFAENELREAGTRYWWDNRPRASEQGVVFQLTLGGSIVLREGETESRVPFGHAALFAYGEDSAYGLTKDDREDYRCAWANLVGAGMREHWDALRARHGSVIVADEPVRRGFARLLALAAPRAHTDPLVMADAVHQFVLDLFRGLGKTLARSQPPVERALDELLRRPTQPSSLKEVAERFGCSREHLTRVFSQRVGMPPATWVNQQRVQKALTLLRETNLAIALVAEQSGFSSAHTLARQVRETTGLSPRAFRRRN